MLGFAWKCWRKSILDNSRDDMFDLRESVRAKFLEEGWGLDSTEYKNIRDLINCAIRYAEDRSLFEVIRVNKIISENETVSKHLSEFKKTILSSKNADIENYLKDTYNSLSDEIFVHLLLSNALTASLLLTIIGIYRLLRPIVQFHRLRPKLKEKQMSDFLATASEFTSFESQAAY